MPPEPDNKMDELLKAYAKKRRTEAGEPMHPATRRLLQAEAAKLRPAAEPEPKSWLTTLRMFWPRVAVAAAVVVVGGIAVISLFPPASEKKEMLFAKHDTETPLVDRYASEERVALPHRSLAPAVVPPAKPSGLPAVTLADDTKSTEMLRAESMPLLAVATQRDVADAEKAEKRMKAADPTRPAAPAPVRMEVGRSSTASSATTVAAGPAAPAAQPPVSDPIALGNVLAESKDKQIADGRGATPQTPFLEGAVASDAKKLDELAASKAKAEAVQQPVPAASAADFAQLNAVELQQQLNNATGRSRFAQVPGANRPSLGKALPSPEATVLTTFLVEQTGDQVRVVDGDGSVYEGKVVAGDAAGAKELEDLTSSRTGGRQDESRRRSLAGQEVRQQQAQTRFNYQIVNRQTSTVWNFRASGTNRTLKQPVTIDAVVYESLMPVTITNVAGVAGIATVGQSLNFYRSTPGEAPAQPPSYTVTTAPSQPAGGAALQNNAYDSQSLYLNNVNNAVRIQGNYRIGPTNQRPLDAVRDGN